MCLQIFQSSVLTQGLGTFTGLIGAFHSTDNTYLQYVDGAIMTDGKFYDLGGQGFGGVYGGGANIDCMMIDTAGTVKPCTNAYVLCEKKLIRDLKMCVDKTTLSANVNVNDSTLVTFARRFKSSMCIEYCRGTDSNQVYHSIYTS